MGYAERKEGGGKDVHISNQASRVVYCVKYILQVMASDKLMYLCSSYQLTQWTVNASSY